MERGGVPFNRGDTRPPVPSRPSIFDSAEMLEFYHGRLSNSEEDKIFKDYLDSKGAFLLRKSNSQADILVISIVVDRKNIYHIKLQQKQNRICVVQSTEEFLTLVSLLEHFQHHDFPGSKHKGLHLIRPIPARRSPRLPSRPIPPKPELKNRSPVKPPRLANDHKAKSIETPPVTPPRLANDRKARSIDERPPMPLPPTQQPIYAEYRHLYSRVDKVETDQLNIILQLCHEVDQESRNVSRMKCSCGLYAEESSLIRGWMMHRDTEGQNTKGRIFFLDTSTEQSVWRLPPELEQELKTSYPEKWKLVCRLMKEPLDNYDY